MFNKKQCLLVNANDLTKTPITPPPPKRRSHSDSSGPRNKKQSQLNHNSCSYLIVASFIFVFSPQANEILFQFCTKHDERNDSHGFYPRRILILIIKLLESGNERGLY